MRSECRQNERERERARVQIDSGAIDAVGPKIIAKALEVKEGHGDVKERHRIHRGKREQHRKLRREKKIASYADDGREHQHTNPPADVKKVLCSARKLNLGGNAVALGGGRGYRQNKETRQRTRINYGEGSYVTRTWLPSKEEEAAWRRRKFGRAVASRSWPRSAISFSVGGRRGCKSARRRPTS